jgi:hypothetical protein
LPWDEAAVGNMSQTAQIKMATKRGENEQFIAARLSSKTWMLEDVETDP